MRGEVLFLERVRRLYKIEVYARVKGGCGNDAENSPPKAPFSAA
jgi:hypothetical protein